jgi:type II secretory pathway pseudopilin PulG
VKFILIIIVILAAAAVMWLLKSRKQVAEKQETYVCDQCGESDCECHKE